MSTNRTKADRLQRQTEELDKRLDDVPEENEKKEVEREEPKELTLTASAPKRRCEPNAA